MCGYLDLGIPVLGICLGLHIIARKFGGDIHPGKSGGYGSVEVCISEHDDILAGYSDKIPVWASHADEVCKLPGGFTLLAKLRDLRCGSHRMPKKTNLRAPVAS